MPTTYQVVAQERICVKKDQKINPENSEFYPIACDPNGAPHSLFDSNGKILWRAKSELWGTTEQDQNREYLADNYLSKKANLPTCELRFAGQWADEESGLHYNLHRYYDPKSAQYLSIDPIGISGGLRTHAYVHDPLGWCDPMGLAGCSSTPKYPLEDGPYIRKGEPYGRPKLSGKAKELFERIVYNRQVGSDGVLLDPNTLEPIDWKPGQPRKGNVDFGHEEGKEYKRIFDDYKNGKVTLKELKEFQSNPKNFILQDPSVNRSHKYELK